MRRVDSLQLWRSSVRHSEVCHITQPFNHSLQGFGDSGASWNGHRYAQPLPRRVVVRGQILVPGLSTSTITPTKDSKMWHLEELEAFFNVQANNGESWGRYLPLYPS